MKISDDDPAYIVRFKAAFTKDLNQRRENINLEWLKVATALDPRFKDLKCLPRAEREPVWAKLSELVKGEEPALQPLREENPQPPKKKTALLLIGSDSESDEETPEDNTVERASASSILTTLDGEANGYVEIPPVANAIAMRIEPRLIDLLDRLPCMLWPFSRSTSGKVRIGHSLNKEEGEYVARRRNTVLQCLQKLNIGCSQDKVPNIALLGSGGGQRAMVGLLGSLVELDKAGLLDCILYLSGVSGSTWCMASLYKEPDWSSKLQTVKDKIIRRISGPGVSWTDAWAKLYKYHENGLFSLTDFWAVVYVTSIVKEIDEHTLTDQWKQHSKDPYPIYTVIDKNCKLHEEGDPWFEISPHEAGYSLIGAFVDTCNFGSQFNKGSKEKHQNEFDMLYLQAMCGSALADEEMICNYLKDLNCLEKCLQVLVDLLDMKLAEIKGADPSVYAEPIQKTLTDIALHSISCFNEWIWGKKYNFLHNMTADAIPTTLLESKMRDYEDAGLLLNSPYFPMLRKERNIDLIISLDFSQGDPFQTVTEAAKKCKNLNIPFPDVNFPSEDVEKPKDFYVFKGQNAPTVIHIPLLNVVNCGDNLKAQWCKYGTFQLPYSPEKITDLMEVAGKNIANNIEKLKEQIRACGQHESLSEAATALKLHDVRKHTCFCSELNSTQTRDGSPRGTVHKTRKRKDDITSDDNKRATTSSAGIN
ncbi:cytosolic phospholipase A2 gamma-like [Garra rufa]|uniref:cytosolic phospholipase A2 gamma-like n=1 Tax=Garra rufa TaxID=137080 RepID=UPI003CCEA0CB